MRMSTKLLTVAGVIVAFTVTATAQQRTGRRPTGPTAGPVFVSALAPPMSPARGRYISVERIASVDGDDNFQAYCASCHGRDGRGAGPAAQALEVPPADLTLIVVRNGTFPSAQVRETIRGNHSGPLVGMPQWTPILQTISLDDSEAMLRLVNLVRHIESVQQR